MALIILLGALTIISFIVFVVVLIIGIAKKKEKLIFTGISLCLVAVMFGIATSVIFIAKSYNAVSKILEKRNGDEIYLALFGKQDNHCVNVLDYQDQTVPKIDYAIWLHFETCPEECQRILTEFEYNKTEIYVNALSKETLKENNIPWWNLSDLGDTIIKYDYTIVDGKNVRTLWISKDYSEVYCRDIYD